VESAANPTAVNRGATRVPVGASVGDSVVGDSVLGESVGGDQVGGWVGAAVGGSPCSRTQSRHVACIRSHHKRKTGLRQSQRSREISTKVRVNERLEKRVQRRVNNAQTHSWGK
jgi:hypothetical protein